MSLLLLSSVTSQFAPSHTFVGHHQPSYPDGRLNMIRLRAVIATLLLSAAATLAIVDDLPQTETSTIVSSTTLYHRILDPLSQPSIWQAWGEVKFRGDGSSEFRETDGQVKDVELERIGEDAWYQVALGLDDTQDPNAVATSGTSSVRLVSSTIKETTSS
jgi:hypothetical protein